MSLREQFATNKTAEISGVWVEYGPNSDGTVPRFKISRMSKANKAYTKALEKATKPHRRSIELETMDENLAEKIFMKVFVSSVLLDWENVQHDDGVGISFREENAIDLFDALPELYDDLQDKAKKASLFREMELEAEAGN